MNAIILVCFVCADNELTSIITRQPVSPYDRVYVTQILKGWGRLYQTVVSRLAFLLQNCEENEANEGTML